MKPAHVSRAARSRNGMLGPRRPSTTSTSPPPSEHVGIQVIAKENPRPSRSVSTDTALPYGICTDIDDDIVVHGLLRGSTVLAPAATGSRSTNTSTIRSRSTPTRSRSSPARSSTATKRSSYAGIPRLRSSRPLWRRTSAVPAQAPAQAQGKDVALPTGAKVLAVVDDMDRNAVLDLVAVLPGPKVLRRHDGTWQEDPGSCVTPPLGEPAARRRTRRSPTRLRRPPSRRGHQRQTVLQGEQEDDAAPRPAMLEPTRWRSNSRCSPTSVGVDAGRVPPLLDRRRRRSEDPLGHTRGDDPLRPPVRKYVGVRAHATCNNISKALGGKGVAWDVD